MKKPRGVFVNDTLEFGYSTRSTIAQAGIGISERTPRIQRNARTHLTDFFVLHALSWRGTGL